MSTKYDGHVYIKIRHVRLRFASSSIAGRYEAKIIGRLEAGIWDTLATTRGHATAEAARAAILKLADRRGIKVTDDPRAVRQIEFRATYGCSCGSKTAGHRRDCDILPPGYDPQGD